MAARSVAKIMRARIFDAFGSERYAFPGLWNLDRRLLEYVPDRPGTFLEIGANDGYSQSNTYYLERHRGWRGILIEPLPSLYRICRAHRTRSRCFNVACVGPDGPSTLTLLDSGLMSVTPELRDSPIDGTDPRRTARRIEVPTRTLSSVIEECAVGRPDLIVIDVEGAEQPVLSGLDLKRHAPDWLLVETDNPQALDAMLAPALQRAAQLTLHDYLYAARQRR